MHIYIRWESNTKYFQSYDVKTFAYFQMLIYLREILAINHLCNLKIIIFYKIYYLDRSYNWRSKWWIVNLFSKILVIILSCEKLKAVMKGIYPFSLLPFQLRLIFYKGMFYITELLVLTSGSIWISMKAV